MFKVKTIIMISSVALGGVVIGHATPATDLYLGHFETQIDYILNANDPNAGWDFSISYDMSNDFSTPEGIVKLDPEDTKIVAAPETEMVLSGAFIGLGSAGDTLWVLPQNNSTGQIFYGWRNVIEAGIFQQSVNGFFTPSNQGNIVIELVDVSGPAVDAGGQFAMWESKSLGGVEVHFNTADQIDADDRLEPAPIGSHTHYNYGLSQPGNYEVTFRASGRLNPWHGGVDTMGEATFSFVVPFASVATGSAELRLALDNDPGPAAIHPHGETVEYAPGQVALETEATTVDDILYPYAFGLDLVTTNANPESHRVGLAGTEAIKFAPGVTLASEALEVLGVDGPGDLQVQLDANNLHYFTFSESGIYRVQLRALANDSGSSINGPEFELVFLAGLGMDYDFNAYADSYERTHNLAAGSLKNDGTDWDGDGIADAIEYQLFWEGLDPTVADAHKLPKPSPEDPDGIMIFYRDTYKDTLNRNNQNIVLEYSADFTNWVGWSDRSQGFPLEQYEVSAENGNAYARIQRRTLRLATADPATAFFRWRIDPAN